MKKLVGISLFLLILYVVLLFSHENASSLGNHKNLGQRIGLYGILSIAAGLVIITGGIDLSMGSVVGLVSTVLCILLEERHWSPWLALLAALGIGGAIGLAHGLLITKLRLQPFLVTLCGLFIYRSLARFVAGGDSKGLGGDFNPTLDEFDASWLGIPNYLTIMLAVAAVVTVFLHFGVMGRYLYAIGSNEKAARYSGIATDRYKILAYVLCSTLTGLFSYLFLMYSPNVSPTTSGSYDELNAIAGAVLGGCSLRGGEGTVFGFLVGTAIIVILRNMTNMFDISPYLENLMIGSILLLGTILDEWLRRRK